MAFVPFIQDCYRTMKKRGELDDVDEAWPEKKKAATEEETEKEGSAGEEEEKEEPIEEEICL